MNLHFCSGNPEKHADIAHLFADSSRPPRSLRQDLVEVLSSDLETVVRAKALAAYERARVPLFVEHGGLFIDALNGLPGPLVKLFWARLPRDELIRLLPAGASRRAEFRQCVAHCDGRRLKIHGGTIVGQIAAQSRGAGGIHWDPIFIPDGQTRTLGEMTRPERLACFGDRGAVARMRADLGI